MVAHFLHRVSLATMAEVKKNFCDDRIAVGQLASHVYLAGVTSACQRKLLVESSVGWLSRTSRRHLLIPLRDFFLLLLFTFNFLEFQRSLVERQRMSWRFSELLSEWFGSVESFFTPKYCPEAVWRLQRLLGLTLNVYSLGIFECAVAVARRSSLKSGQGLARRSSQIVIT